MGVAKDERTALCDLFVELGPDEPTLCEGWHTRDLAAHLVIRERRPDAAPGILIKPLAGYARRVQDSYARRPWTELVGAIRSGPPRYWPSALDELVNTTEFFVHHEDVRRARPGWQPRPPDERRDRALWGAVARSGRMLLRHSPVGVVLRRSDRDGRDGREVTARRGPSTVIISGPPGELLLFAFGRDRALVDFEGDQSSIGLVKGVTRGL
ncbi:MAG TPA: TIGR03085 family metal-binding protein [Actinophytocola sp.]|uniref:TIGR03085 family metal-binding protein n=1 Tax=Actinophytocola sp. TaxID=1872138 RepID=UPI002DDDB0DB|nr:TIGR03085 family metal-binding protein [Actinophytocola sp.]HEV2784202.1 TIGR03085 family metal-binding protein [Actinophytocola sp.]